MRMHFQCRVTLLTGGGAASGPFGAAPQREIPVWDVLSMNRQAGKQAASGR